MEKRVNHLPLSLQPEPLVWGRVDPWPGNFHSPAPTPPPRKGCQNISSVPSLRATRGGGHGGEGRSGSYSYPS